MPPTSVSAAPAVSNALAAARVVAAFCAHNAAAIDGDDTFPVAEFQRIAEAGLLMVPLLPSHEGLGWGAEPGEMGELLRLLSLLGEGNLSVARLYEGHVNALLLVQQFGTVDQINEAAADARDRQRIFAVWNTEARDGVRLVPYDDGRYGLEGAKTFASGAGFVERPLITAALPNGGWQMILLDLRLESPAVDQASWRPIGMKATASGRIDFTGMTVSNDALIGQPGDYYRQPWFGAGAVRFAAAQFGGAIALVEAARNELQKIGRTADVIQQERLGQMSIGLETGALLLERAGKLADCSLFGGAVEPTVDDRTMTAYANLVRTAIERICLDAIEYAQRSVGARSLLKPHPIERISRDLSLYLRQPAPDAAVRNVGEFGFEQTEPMRDAWGRAE